MADAEECLKWLKYCHKSNQVNQYNEEEDTDITHQQTESGLHVAKLFAEEAVRVLSNEEIALLYEFLRESGSGTRQRYCRLEKCISGLRQDWEVFNEAAAAEL